MQNRDLFHSSGGKGWSGKGSISGKGSGKGKDRGQHAQLHQTKFEGNGNFVVWSPAFLQQPSQPPVQHPPQPTQSAYHQHPQHLQQQHQQPHSSEPAVSYLRQSRHETGATGNKLDQLREKMEQQRAEKRLENAGAKYEAEISLDAVRESEDEAAILQSVAAAEKFSELAGQAAAEKDRANKIRQASTLVGEILGSKGVNIVPSTKVKLALDLTADFSRFRAQNSALQKLYIKVQADEEDERRKRQLKGAELGPVMQARGLDVADSQLSGNGTAHKIVEPSSTPIAGGEAREAQQPPPPPLQLQPLQEAAQAQEVQEQRATEQQAKQLEQQQQQQQKKRRKHRRQAAKMQPRTAPVRFGKVEVPLALPIFGGDWCRDDVGDERHRERLRHTRLQHVHGAVDNLIKRRLKVYRVNGCYTKEREERPVVADPRQGAAYMNFRGCVLECVYSFVALASSALMLMRPVMTGRSLSRQTKVLLKKLRSKMS
jgi:hypothetical protein